METSGAVVQEEKWLLVDCEELERYHENKIPVWKQENKTLSRISVHIELVFGNFERIYNSIPWTKSNNQKRPPANPQFHL